MIFDIVAGLFIFKWLGGCEQSSKVKNYRPLSWKEDLVMTILAIVILFSPVIVIFSYEGYQHLKKDHVFQKISYKTVSLFSDKYDDPKIRDLCQYYGWYPFDAYEHIKDEKERHEMEHKYLEEEERTIAKQMTSYKTPRAALPSAYEEMYRNENCGVRLHKEDSGITVWAVEDGLNMEQSILFQNEKFEIKLSWTRYEPTSGSNGFMQAIPALGPDLFYLNCRGYAQSLPKEVKARFHGVYGIEG